MPTPALAKPQSQPKRALCPSVPQTNDEMNEPRLMPM